MAIDIQNTTLAGAPYFDDFANAEANNYHRVLFKPSVAVQARELTQLQTILQNQVERFGDNIYRRGTILDGCNMLFDAAYNYIKVLDTQVSGQSVAVSEFADSIIEDYSGLQARVVNYVPGLVSQSPDLNTLYIKYTNVGSIPSSDGSTTDVKEFTANTIVTAYNKLRRVERVEVTQGGVGYTNSDVVVFTANNDVGSGAQGTIVTNSSGTITSITMQSKGINYTNPPTVSVLSVTGVGAVLSAINNIGQLTIANTLFSSVGTGFAIQITDGYIYQKGHFLKVSPQTLIVSKYATNTDGFPNNSVVGFKTAESIATSLTDSTLLDNATGSLNEMAPGADRLKLVPVLSKYDSLSEAALDNNFLSLIQFENGQIVRSTLTTSFNSIDTELTRRTYEESGDYVVKQFGVYAEEKLDPTSSTSNTLISNTTHVNIVVAPGIGYVNGLRTETTGNRRLPVRKGTDTNLLNNVNVSTGFGSFVYVNELAGNFSALASTTVTLYGGTTGVKALTLSPGSIPSMPSASIGTAKIRGLEFDSGIQGTPSGVYRMYLYDIKLNQGKSFADTYVIGITSTAAADVVRSSGKAVLQDVTKDGLIFTTGVDAVKALSDTSLTYRSSNSSTSITTGGQLSISVSAPGVTLPYTTGTTLSVEEKQGIVIVPTVSTRSGNLTGTVANGTANSLTGTSTTFTSSLQVGDTIYAIVSGTPYINRVTEIVSDLSLKVANTWPVSITGGSNIARAFPAYQPVGLDRATVTVNTTTSMTVDLGVTLNTAATSTTVLFDSRIDNPTPRIKKIRKDIFVRISATATGSNPNGPWCLGIPDVHKITGVYLGSGVTYANPSSATNYVDQFELMNGQNDSMYGLSYIRRAPSATVTTAGGSVNLVVKMEVYYDHNVVSGGAFYAGAASYPIDDANREANTAAITTEEIEIFKSPKAGVQYDLRNSVDFRPVVANTADSSATVYTSSTIDPSSTEALATSINYMPSPRGAVQTDIEYYLGRIDSISLVPSQLSSTVGGSLVVVEGTPSVTPSAARTPESSMVLASIVVPPYPSLDPLNAKQANRADLSVKTTLAAQQKRYTMRDIGFLEKKIDRLEYYSLLNRMESSAKDLAADRTLNGFFTDSFEDFNMTNVNDLEYNAFIDTQRGELRSRVYSETLDLVIDTSAGAQNAGVNTSFQDQVLLNFSTRSMLDQPFASQIRNLAGELWRFKGNVFIYPKYDGQYDRDVAPARITVDLTNAQRNIIDAVNSAFGQMDGRTTVLGTSTALTTSRSTDSERFAGGTLTTTEVTTVETTTVVGAKARASLSVGNEQTTLTGQFSTISDVDFQPWMRAGPITFLVTGLRPGARHYVYFDDKDVNQYVIPCAYTPVSNVTINSTSVAPTGAQGAELRADSNGNLAGIFNLPAETFYVGQRLLKIMDVPNIASEPSAVSFASAAYNAYNINIDHQQVSISTKQLDPVTVDWRTYWAGTLSSAVTGVSTSISSTFVADPPPPDSGDPLAQTFLIPEDVSGQTDGVHISHVQVYFASAAANRGVVLQIRDVVNGYPGPNILPFATKRLPPEQIITSTTSTLGTEFRFDTPVFLNSAKEYAIVIMPEGNSPDFYIWTGAAGEVDVNNPDVRAKTDWGRGQLFTSVNNSAWKPQSFEDIKFSLHRAEFTPNSVGTVTLAPDNYEFLTLDAVSGSFTRGERIAQRSSTYNVGDVVTSNTARTISGVSTLYGADLSSGDTILITYGINPTSAITGTANGTTTSANLTGSSTTFTSDVAVGDFLKINGNIRQVVNIANNIHLTLDAPLSNTTYSASVYKFNNIGYDVIKVNQITNDTTIVGDRVPKYTTNSTVSAVYMKVVSAEVDRYRVNDRKLYLKSSNASNVNFTFVKSSYTSLNANSGRMIIAGQSNAVANVVSVDNLAVNYVDSEIRTIAPTGTGIQVSYSVSKVGSAGQSPVNGTSTGVTVLPFESVIYSKSNQIANSMSSASFRVISSLGTASNFVSPALDISPAQVQVMRNIIDNYTSTTQTCNTTSGSASVAVANGSLLAVGMGVRGKAIPNDTTITNINGNTLTLSKNASGALTNTTLEFHPNETSRYGISQNKYISKFMVLADGSEAEDFKLWITAYRPINTQVDVYAKFISEGDNESSDNKEWSLLTLEANKDVYSDPLKDTDYKEYSYVLPKSPPFSQLTGRGQTNSNTTLTGLSTAFTSELAQNDIIKIVKADTTTANGAPLYGEYSNYVIRTVTAIANTTSLTLDSSVSADTGLRIQKVTQPRAAFAYPNTTPQYLMTYHGAAGDGTITAQYRNYKYVAVKIVLRSTNTSYTPVVRDVRALAMMV